MLSWLTVEAVFLTPSTTIAKRGHEIFVKMKIFNTHVHSSCIFRSRASQWGHWRSYTSLGDRATATVADEPSSFAQCGVHQLEQQHDLWPSHLPQKPGNGRSLSHLTCFRIPITFDSWYMVYKIQDFHAHSHNWTGKNIFYDKKKKFKLCTCNNH